MPQLPRLAVLAVALAIAAVVLFFLPALLGVGGGGTPGTATPSPSASQGVESSNSPEPSVSVAPSPQVYVVKAGDTMSKIAARYGLKADALCAANKATITNCDKIAIGDELVIPTTAPDVINDASAEPSAS
jgi:LysM repeat protein